MKTQIRVGVFETNSSSTHSVIICSKEDYENFKKGTMILDTEEEKLICKDDYRFKTYQDYLFQDDDELEYYEREYTTSHGDEIVVFGKYGYDG